MRDPEANFLACCHLANIVKWLKKKTATSGFGKLNSSSASWKSQISVGLKKKSITVHYFKKETK